MAYCEPKIRRLPERGVTQILSVYPADSSLPIKNSMAIIVNGRLDQWGRGLTFGSHRDRPQPGVPLVVPSQFLMHVSVYGESGLQMS